ncbi:hypothetical protein C7I85_22730 [Mesorhizobium soli]|uniref:Uncharacterized protein n=2 Tax=Pseudaminobacter soli (ex Li et al. 2025) TaxID=1295366 RepID=A0A2P7S4J8_9HYPH|nr:hypothetical protein C7I85_22730 [Mesorhizobium soli]
MHVAPIDQMDEGMDMLRTCWAALQDMSVLDDKMVLSIRCTLAVAIETLKPVRETVNKAHGEGRI